MSLEPVIRREERSDWAAIASVHEAAFPTAAEARLVERLRAAGHASISLVAVLHDRVVGHILLSPVTIGGRSDVAALGLAPVAVTPGSQGRGIGSVLIRASLAEARQSGASLVVVLGEPAYYARFGFQRASDLGLGNEYQVDEEFRAVVFAPQRLPSGGGIVRYGPEFAELA